jgi:hypothetical protein
LRSKFNWFESNSSNFQPHVSKAANCEVTTISPGGQMKSHAESLSTPLHKDFETEIHVRALQKLAENYREATKQSEHICGILSSFLIMATSNTSTQDSPMIQAASQGNVDKLSSLLSHSEMPQAKDIQPLLAAAAWKAQLPVVEYLLTNYHQYRINEETVRAAIYSGSIPLFSRLLAHDRTIANMQFDQRGTPLVVACMSHRPIEFLEVLLEAGADPNQVSPSS